MSVPDYRSKNIYEELEDRFVYKEDIGSLYFLLSISDYENKFKGLKPKYICNKKIKNSLRRHLYYRGDRDSVISALMTQINDDINRLELAYYINFYTLGYDSKIVANDFEGFVLRNLQVKNIQYRKKLFHDNKSITIDRIRKPFINKVMGNKNINLFVNDLVYKYCDKLIRSKVLSLNRYLNKQLIFKYDAESIYVSEEQILTKNQLINLYKLIVKVYSKAILGLCEDAIWYGLNDRVLDRYK